MAFLHSMILRTYCNDLLNMPSTTKTAANINLSLVSVAAVAK